MKREIPENATVFFTHLRPEEGGDPSELFTAHDARLLGVRLAAKGGLTLCQIELPGDDDQPGPTVRAAAKCNARDNFCKATGRLIALGRALKALEDANA